MPTSTSFPASSSLSASVSSSTPASTSMTPNSTTLPHLRRASNSNQTLTIALSVTAVVALSFGICLIVRFLHRRRAVYSVEGEYVKLGVALEAHEGHHDGAGKTLINQQWDCTFSDDLSPLLGLPERLWPALCEPSRLGIELAAEPIPAMGLEAPLPSGQTLLQSAVALDQVESVQLLLDHGAQFWVTDVLGNTLLHIAASHDLDKMMTYLLSQSDYVDIHSHFNGPGDTFVHVRTSCLCVCV
eukprot:m.281774 g.281774  ORF g.281774 m.281774 type:complete len:243 (-) comp17743_c0_seq7:618-1346(-)